MKETKLTIKKLIKICEAYKDAEMTKDDFLKEFSNYKIIKYVPLEQKNDIAFEINTKFNNNTLLAIESYSYQYEYEVSIFFQLVCTYLGIEYVYENISVEAYDLLIKCGFYDSFIEVVGKDYKRFEDYISKCLRFDSIIQVMSDFKLEDESKLEANTKEIQDFLNNMSETDKKMLTDITGYNDPILKQLKEALETQEIGNAMQKINKQ